MADYDYSKKSDAALEKMIEKDSGASVEQAKAAYNELSKRRGDMGFTVTMILGGRKLDEDSKPIPVPKPRPKREKNKSKKPEMAYGGMAKGKKHMYVAGGSVTENPGLKALKASGPKGMEAYNKITGK